MENENKNDYPKNVEDGIGRPIGIRHHLSGVWVARLVGPGIKPHMIRIRGRRLWSWKGERLECSQVFNSGPMPGDKLGDETTADIPVGEGDQLVELTFDVTEETLAAYLNAPRTEV